MSRTCVIAISLVLRGIGSRVFLCVGVKSWDIGSAGGAWCLELV